MNMKKGRSILRMIGLILASMGIGISIYLFNQPDAEKFRVLTQLTYICIIFSILLALLLDKTRKMINEGGEAIV
ncbi:hypothetical protein [Planococcus halocryophilus]|uniref:hypothetical protein n=1 Tax=Planococcus halocryophilus TaxID=1215089 RepID=UPI001F101F1A|nr:hypothetical protein [Planococcus halocryophilus]MCH4825365.1 hypothetical protein [Planococcus halocryophilus]